MPLLSPGAASRRSRRPLLLASLLGLLACSGDQAGEAMPESQAAAARPQPAATEAPDPRVAAADSARILGSTSAPVWVIDVSDFQCPFCRVWHESTFDQLREEFVQTGRVRFAYVNMPLRQHRHAREAANFAMCAGAQGRFFEYADQLFSTQDAWSSLPSATEHFTSLAEAAGGLDATTLAQCVADGVMEPLIDADYERAMQAGVGSTPSFIVGNRRLEGVQSIENLRAAIEAAEAAVSAPAADTVG